VFLRRVKCLPDAIFCCTLDQARKSICHKHDVIVVAIVFMAYFFRARASQHDRVQ